MHPYLLPLNAGRTVSHPSFVHLQLPEQAVIVEVWPGEQAELNNGLLLPTSELTYIDTSERWLPIKGHESYLISSHGKIVGLNYNRTNRQRLMCVQKPKTYPLISLMTEGGTKQCGINRLVAQTFLPIPESRMTMVIPLDGNRLNLRIENLRWVDPHEKEDIVVLGYLYNCGSKNKFSKLSINQIFFIQQQIAAGRSQQSIADELEVSRPVISLIAAGKAWRCAQQQLPLKGC